MKKLTQQEMIDEVMESFDFDYVHDAMTKLERAWYFHPNGYEIPSIDDLKRRARDIIHRSTTTVLGDDPTYQRPRIVGSGGLRVTSWKTKKGKLRTLNLEFIIANSYSRRKTT